MSVFKSFLNSYGPDSVVAYVRWAPSASATQTLTEARGVTSVTRSGAGTYTINLTQSCNALTAFPAIVDNNTTHYIDFRVTSTSASSGTVSVELRSVAFASVASGPSGTDTCDELEVLILMRTGS